MCFLNARKSQLICGHYYSVQKKENFYMDFLLGGIFLYQTCFFFQKETSVEPFALYNIKLLREKTVKLKGGATENKNNKVLSKQGHVVYVHTI